MEEIGDRKTISDTSTTRFGKTSFYSGFGKKVETPKIKIAGKVFEL